MKFLIGIMIILVLFMAARWAIAHIGSAPATLGIKNGHLQPCPDSPNCVSSVDANDSHQIAGLQLGESMTIADIAVTLRSQPRVSVVTEQEDYLHATYKSRLLGFIDDLELQATENPGYFNIRSAARLGVSDLGVNRKRVDALRRSLSNQ